MQAGEKVFVDSGAWIALAVVRDPLHERAKLLWEQIHRDGARVCTSVPVVVETFTYLDRRCSRELALRWRESLMELPRCEVLGCARADLEAAWGFLARRELHKLSLVDATSFALMRKHQIRSALAFDTHFGLAGFRYVG
ncbi:MAG: PIN domain-containing protein [Myxococcales bacterium]|nr:PIN domain-containing protein [Myxococcales bacterium]